MKFGILSLYLLIFFFLPAKANYFDVTKDGSTIVVHELFKDKLFIANPSKSITKFIQLRDGSEDWVKIVHDSLIIVHFASGEHTEIYHLHTSKKVKTFSDYYLPDEKEEFLYSCDYDTGKLAVKRTSQRFSGNGCDLIGSSRWLDSHQIIQIEQRWKKNCRCNEFRL